MEIMYVMIGLSLLMAIGFLIAFIWSIRSGQQDDLITPSMRILLEEKEYKKKQLNAYEHKNYHVRAIFL
jgi:cbb3-type cytochrome oxidase maturation protein